MNIQELIDAAHSIASSEYGTCRLCGRVGATRLGLCGRGCAPIPAKALECSCQHGPHTTDGTCPIHVTAGITSRGFVTCDCAKCHAGRPAPHPGRRTCKTWCGLETLSELVPNSGNESGDGINGPVLWKGPLDDKLQRRPYGRSWCSASCRDARLPPISDAPATPAPEAVKLTCPHCPLLFNSAEQLAAHAHPPAKAAPVPETVKPANAAPPWCACGGKQHYLAPSCPRPSSAKAAPVAKMHDFGDPYCRNFNRPDIGDRTMVRCCSACGKAKNADNIGGRCVPNDWRERFEANLNADGKANVLHNDKVPTRLPAPRMVHSAMWLDTEDC